MSDQPVLPSFDIEVSEKRHFTWWVRDLSKPFDLDDNNEIRAMGFRMAGPEDLESAGYARSFDLRGEIDKLNANLADEAKRGGTYNVMLQGIANTLALVPGEKIETVPEAVKKTLEKLRTERDSGLLRIQELERELRDICSSDKIGLAKAVEEKNAYMARFDSLLAASVDAALSDESCECRGTCTLTDGKGRFAICACFKQMQIARDARKERDERRAEKAEISVWAMRPTYDAAKAWGSQPLTSPLNDHELAIARALFESSEREKNPALKSLPQSGQSEPYTDLAQANVRISNLEAQNSNLRAKLKAAGKQ
jgi:hypothetical protein